MHWGCIMGTLGVHLGYFRDTFMIMIYWGGIEDTLGVY